MTILILGLILFLGTHSLSIVARPLRNRLFQRSPNMWKLGYSLLSFVGLYLIAVGYAEARLQFAPIYSPPVWTRHLVMLLMVPVFPLIIAAHLRSNIKSKLKHPMLVAVKLWALVHLIANGGPADLILFGSFLIWAVITRISLKRRPDQAAIPSGIVTNDIIAIVLGLVIYGIFVVWAHGFLIGKPLLIH